MTRGSVIVAAFLLLGAPVSAQTLGAPTAHERDQGIAFIQSRLSEEPKPTAPDLYDPTSIYTLSLPPDIWLEGIPAIPVAARATKLAIRIPIQRFGLPAEISATHNRFKFGLSSRIVTPAAAAFDPSVIDPRPVPGSDFINGELRGRIEYDNRFMESYGAAGVGVAAAGNIVPVLHDVAAFGTYMKFPDWLSGAKFGGVIEWTAGREIKTRLEYRRKLGGVEGYVTAERIAFEALEPVEVYRAGINQKF